MLNLTISVPIGVLKSVVRAVYDIEGCLKVFLVGDWFYDMVSVYGSITVLKSSLCCNLEHYFSNRCYSVAFFSSPYALANVEYEIQSS